MSAFPKLMRSLTKGFILFLMLSSVMVVLFFHTPALWAALKTGRKDVSAGALIVSGNELFQKGRLEQAAVTWEKALEILAAESNTGMYLDLAVRLTTAYQALGYYDKALALLTSFLPVIDKIEDAQVKAVLYNTLGDVYLSTNDFSSALKYFESGLKAARSIENPLILATILNNVGNALAIDGDYEGAKSAYAESLIHIGDNTDLHLLKIRVLINISRAEFQTKAYPSSINALKFALEK